MSYTSSALQMTIMEHGDPADLDTVSDSLQKIDNYVAAINKERENLTALLGQLGLDQSGNPLITAAAARSTLGAAASGGATGTLKDAEDDIEDLQDSVSYLTYGNFSQIPNDDNIRFCCVTYQGTDSDAPDTNDGPWWWNVIQFGNPLRLIQIAWCPYRNRDKLYMRQRHDTNWHGWYILSPNTTSTATSGFVGNTDNVDNVFEQTYKKTGNVVTLRIGVHTKKSLATEGSMDLGTIPAAYRPSTTLYAFGNDARYMFRVATTGVITWWNYRTSETPAQNVYVTATYVVG